MVNQCINIYKSYTVCLLKNEGTKRERNENEQREEGKNTVEKMKASERKRFSEQDKVQGSPETTSIEWPFFTCIGSSNGSSDDNNIFCLIHF